MSLVAMSFNQDIDGELWGVKWDLATLTYGFGTATSQYLGYQVGSISGFSPFNATQQAAAHEAVAQVSGLVNLNITFTADGSAANLRFAMASAVTQYVDNVTFQPMPGTITTAVGTPPDPFLFPTFAHGDMFFNLTDYNVPIKGNFAYATVLHELGHALGLKHGHVSQDYPDHSFVIPALPANHDGMEFSIMSYRSDIGGGADHYRNEDFGYAQSYMMNDIAALQYLYGADFSFRSGNTAYKWDPATGQMFVDGVGQGVPGANRVFLTIWDGNGIDTYDMSNYATNLRVNLAPGSWSLLSASQLATLNAETGGKARANVFNALQFNNDARSLIENANGGRGSDVITGNNANNTLSGNDGNDILKGANGDDSLKGGAGTDTLDGGRGNDTLSGAAGNDTILCGEGNDRIVGGAGRDAITCGLGNDSIIFNSLAEAGDTIADFSSKASNNDDRFQFAGAAFGHLAAGSLATGQFQSSASATALSPAVRFFYEEDTHVLRYDADGSGLGSAAVVIATLQATATMTIADIAML